MDINAEIVGQLESQIADLKMKNLELQELVDDLEHEICYFEEESNLDILRADMRLDIILGIVNAANDLCSTEGKSEIGLDFCKDCGELINLILDGKNVPIGLHGQLCEIENSISF